MMMPQQPKYRIYPSLLDAYQALLDYETVAEEPWNRVSDAAHARGEFLDKDVGDYKLSPDEMYVKLEADLIDSINRIDGEYSEAADKGTAFNEIVDCLIEHRKSDKVHIEREYETIYPTLPITDADGNVITAKRAIKTDKVVGLKASLHGFSFIFDIDLCREAAKYFAGSLTQFRVQSVIRTEYGDVEVYGFIDEWRGSKMFDIKTTSYYDFGKFERKWQKVLYPWAAISSGLTTDVESFEYSVFVLTKTPIINAKFYREVYNYDHTRATLRLRSHIESFIRWLESRRSLITDKRIFGGSNPNGYVGIPIDPSLLRPKLKIAI